MRTDEVRAGVRVLAAEQMQALPYATQLLAHLGAEVVKIEPIIRPALEAWARDKTKLEAADALCQIGVAAGPSNLAEDLARDPHVAARNMLVEVPRTDSPDPMLVVGNPVKLSRSTDGPISTFPGLGEHTDTVLADELGLDAPALAALREQGVI